MWRKKKKERRIRVGTGAEGGEVVVVMKEKE